MRDQTPGGFPYRQHPHEFCGSNTARQEVGDPGHCEDCCSVGHVVAHPDLGCGDVGCYRTHGDPMSDQTPRMPEDRAQLQKLEQLGEAGSSPRMPNFWWCPTHHLYRGGIERPCADAVKLGDVEEVRELLDRTRRSRDNHMNRAIRAERDRDKLREDLAETTGLLLGLRADIRAVLATKQPYIGWHREQVLARLDREPGREESTDPRVFFPGDTVPAEVEVWTKDRAVYRWGTDRQLLPYEGAMVEVLYPSPAEWQAIVDRARAARGHVVEHQPDTEESDG